MGELSLIILNNNMPITITASVSSRRITIAKPFELRGYSTIRYDRIIAGGEATELVIGDRNIFRTNAATYVYDYQIIPLTYGGAGRYTPTFISSDPSIATVDNNGLVTHVSNGVATITMSAGNQSISDTLYFQTLSSGNVDTFNSYLSGSLAYHISDTIDSRLVGKNKVDNLKIFTTQNHSTQTYVRNPNVWCADLPNLLTCMSPWNSTGGSQRAGTLISPRHIIFAAHFQINTNATIRFVKMDGTVVNRTMTNKITHPSYAPYYPDITVGLLDSDVPEDISFAKVLPSDWSDYLPSLNVYTDGEIPAIALDQEEKALVTDWYRETVTTAFNSPTSSDRLEMFELLIGGDSGNPAIIPINGEPVILTVWTFGGAGAGTSISNQVSAINSMMTTLGGGYQLTTISLSSFNNYSS